MELKEFHTVELNTVRSLFFLMFIYLEDVGNLHVNSLLYK